MYIFEIIELYCFYIENSRPTLFCRVPANFDLKFYLSLADTSHGYRLLGVSNRLIRQGFKAAISNNLL